MHVILMYRTHLSFSAVVQNFLRCPVKLSKALILSSLTELRERERDREGGRGGGLAQHISSKITTMADCKLDTMQNCTRTYIRCT